MKLSDIESKQLLPRFAKKISWVMDTLDALIRPTVERVKSIDAPLTMESIQACTDEELEALYDQYGVAQYYPDLARDTRDKMLYEMARIYRYLGTPHAIETLCEYIFDGVQLNVKVLDNLAFDEEGELVDESLLDTFDIQVEPSIPVLDEYTNTRILANIIRFSRNSQALRDILYDFPETFELPVSPLYAGIPSQNWENDAICEPVTPPTPSYTEITLYMQSGNKQAQSGVTSSYTGNVNSSYCYQLYTDEACTIPWKEYDYSNDYELGRYVDGVWTPYIRQNVANMPASTTGNYDYVFGRILLDTGELWHVTNYQITGTTSNLNPIVRIYPKAQQYYAAYFQTANAYTNNNFTDTDKIVYFAPNQGGSARFYGHYIADNGALVEVLGSAGNSVMRNTDSLGASSVSGNSYLRMHQPQSLSRNARCLVFSLPNRTLVGWVNLGGGNTIVSSGALVRLKDANGNAISYESNVKYTAVSFLATNDGIGAEALYDGKYGIGSDDTYPGDLCVKQVHGSISINRIWIAMEQVTDSIWAYFTNGGSSSLTNTPQTSGQSYLLYDENGNPIIYDSTKSYETLELQYIASGKYLMRGQLGFSSFVASANNQLQCTATLTNSIGVNRVRVWIK